MNGSTASPMPRRVAHRSWSATSSVHRVVESASWAENAQIRPLIHGHKEIARILGHSHFMPGQSSQWITTARVLRRAGFGVTGPEVDAAVSRDWSGYVDAMLAANPD